MKLTTITDLIMILLGGVYLAVWDIVLRINPEWGLIYSVVGAIVILPVGYKYVKWSRSYDEAEKVVGQEQ